MQSDVVISHTPGQAVRKPGPAKIDYGLSAGPFDVRCESKGKCMWIKMSQAKTDRHRAHARLVSSMLRTCTYVL